jgi:RNA recognition motif-containing protein
MKSFWTMQDHEAGNELKTDSSDNSNCGELTSATAALLDPNILKMFVDSLTRSITGNESPCQSILGIDDNIETPTVTAPQVATPSSRVSSIETPSLMGDGGIRRSATNMSIISTETTASSSTIMLRNVPYDARQRGVLTLIEEEGFRGLFDFFYAPLDFKSKNNLGYAFVNFKSLEIAKDFFKRFDGKRVSSRPGWDKPLRVCWARVQGFEANIDHYRNSPVNEMPTEFKPMLFDEDGEPVPFPAPDTARDESRRSCHLRNGGNSTTVRPRERRLQSQLSRGFLTPVNSNSSINNLMTYASKTPQPVSNNQFKLFVGGLSPETTSDELEDYMKRFGPVDDCHVLIDATTGRSRCYGFCTYSDAQGARSALAHQQTHLVGGRGVVVRPYTSNGRQ